MEPALTVIYKLHLERALISVLLSCNPEVNSWVIENNTWGGEEGYTLQRLCAKKELHARSILHISHFAFFGDPFDLSYFVVRKSASRRVFPALKPALKNAQYPLFFNLPVHCCRFPAYFHIRPQQRSVKPSQLRNRSVPQKCVRVS